MATAAESTDDDGNLEKDFIGHGIDNDSTTSSDEMFYHSRYTGGDLWKFPQMEIQKIAREIGQDWYDIGIKLGYEKHQLDNLAEITKDQLNKRTFWLLTEWFTTVSRLQLDARKQLAVHLHNSDRTDLAEKIGVYYKDVNTPKSMYRHIRDISFDRGNMDMGSIHIGSVVVYNYNTHVHLGDNQLKTKDDTDRKLAQEHSVQRDGNNVFLRKDQTRKPNNTLNERQNEIKELVKKLDLKSFFPSKISLQDVRTIKSADELSSEKLIHLPWLLLDKLILFNCKAREIDLDRHYENETSDEDDTDKDIFDEPESNHKMNPMDVFLVTFLSCDLLLKQDIITRLFTCRIAIPVIYRDEKNVIILSKWAMKQIVLIKHTSEGYCHVDALKCEAKRVAFIRLGQPELSKSKILNELLSGQNHPTFYNRDCPLGASRRIIATGTVEGAWYMPSGGTNDVFGDIVMFLNLRGDCMHHNEELDLLSILSDIIVVHTNVENLEKREIKSVLMKLQEKNVYVIYALESSENSNVKPNDILKAFKKHMQQFKDRMQFFSLQGSRSGCRNQSAADKIKELRKLLSNALTNVCQSSIIKHIEERLDTDDKMSSICLKGTIKARKFMKMLKNESGLKKKQDILPLQGNVWQEHCTATKTLYRSKSSEERERLKNITLASREKQILILRSNIYANVNEVLKHYMALKDDTLSFNAYITNIMLDFDDESRNVLPSLRRKYQDLWTEMKVAKTKSNADEYSRIRKLMDEAENELVAASFGIEHIIRELGQMYEASHEYGYRNFRARQKTCVQFASLYLRLGYPFEIMDGDTSMIPLQWVKAVFQQLIVDIGDKNLLAISVLGVQSSGKSTLLNTMFGLKFPVCAGRCTRGVFVQLVPVTKLSLPFSYVLVVDTEGLRAPELVDQNYSRDNELATFVLGLGNITIINIKGENTSEMENVLQIAVHAFLRLKMANKKLKLQQTCIFTHQNVPAVDASDAMSHARKKVMDKLDEMTAAAADQEGLADVTSFNQVIEIDPKSHMWYFSDLYFGDPPMAPINLGYSEKVAKVKNHILFDIAVKKKIFLTISETMSLIEDLRNGILSDDFVFSFRNSLEMKAYYLMESMFNKIVWGIENEIHDIFKKASTKFARCLTDKKLNSTESMLTSNLKKKLIDEQKLCQEKLNNYIDSSSLKEIMEQWRQNRENRLIEFILELERKSIKNIERKKKRAAAELVRTKKRTFHKMDIHKNAMALADKFKTNTQLLTPELILDHFNNNIWKKWVGDIEQDTSFDEKPVKDQIQETLYEQFHPFHYLISKELEKPYTPRTCDLSNLQCSFPASCILEDDISYQSDTNVTKISALKVINMIFAKIDSFISDVKHQDNAFEKSWVTSIFQMLTESIDQHNNGYRETTHFKLTATLKVKLAVHITRYITDVFTDLDTRYREKHDFTAEMDDYKNVAFVEFANTVKNQHDVWKMTDNLIETVEKKVYIEVEKSVPIEVVKTVIDECFSTKYSLILTLMRDLAIKEDFKLFHWYINDPQSYAKGWIIEFTNKRLFGTTDKVDSRYNRIVTKLVQQYMHDVHESLNSTRKVVKATKCSMGTWITDLEEHLSQFLPIPVDLFDFYKHSDTEIDCNVVIEHYIDKIKECEKRLLKKFSIANGRHIKWKKPNPYIAIFDKLWGCEHVCPFCRETCQKTTKCHIDEPHTCVQHRPPGLKGVRQMKTQYMSWEACNYKVYSDITFYCGASDKKCQSSGKCNATGVHGSLHFYRQYASLMPDWEIEPSPRREASLYWMWFTYRFRKELEQTYGYIMPPVVETWEKITKEDAINSLKMRGY